MSLLSAPTLLTASEEDSVSEDNVSENAAPADSTLLPLDRIKCSSWARSGLADAYGSGLLPAYSQLGADYTQPITREQFVFLAVELAAAVRETDISALATEYGLIASPADDEKKEAAGKGEAPAAPEFVSPFSDTDSLHAALASAMGIAKGNNGLFRPDDGVSRCEAAAFLQRCMSSLGCTEANSQPAVFSDSYEMPRWSVESIKFCSGRTTPDGSSVMGGSAGLFSPTGSLTIEQAILTLLRCRSSLADTGVCSGWREAPGYDTVTLNLTFGGDCTFGNGIGFSYSGSFPEMFSQVDPSYFFSGISEFFDDDLTMVNFEGTLTSATTPAVKTYCFKGLPEYAKALQAGSIDVVTVANNHSHDYLQQGYEDTLKNLSPYVAVSGYDNLPIVNVKGVNIGFASNEGWSYDANQRAFIDNSIADLRARGADIVVFNYHWGIERSYHSNATQQSIAHYCIDQGADLVIGNHPHVAQETETYKGKQIAYSLGNLVFGGNHNPSDKNCLIFRQSFTVDLNSRSVTDAGSSALPYKISSVNWRNDYHPVKR